MAHSCKKETEILADAMVSASALLDDASRKMVLAIDDLASHLQQVMSAADALITVLNAYYPPPLYLCEKHGEIEPVEIIYYTMDTLHGECNRYCPHCRLEDGGWTLLYKWSDQLMREDFEISPRSPKN